MDGQFVKKSRNAEEKRVDEENEGEDVPTALQVMPGLGRRWSIRHDWCSCELSVTHNSQKIDSIGECRGEFSMQAPGLELGRIPAGCPIERSQAQVIPTSISRHPVPNYLRYSARRC